MIQFVLSTGTAFLEIFFLDGAAVGWPSLQFVLEKEGYFSYYCNNNSSNVTSSYSVANTTLPNQTNCASQDASFNLAYTLWLSALFLCSFPVGCLFDRLANTWLFRCVFAALFSLSCILLTISTPATSEIIYPAMIILSIGGYGLALSNFQLANITKSARNSLLTAMSGTFDSAVVVFLILKKGYDFGVDLRTLFLAFTLFSLFAWIRTFMFLPKGTIPFPLESLPVIYGWKEWVCFKKAKLVPVRIDVKTISQDANSNGNSEIKNGSSNEENYQPEVSFKCCLLNKLLWTSIFHLSALNLRLAVFYGAVSQWLEGLGETQASISKLIDDLGVILLFTVAVAPLNGLLVDLIKRFLKSTYKNERVCNLKASFVSMVVSTFFGVLMSIMAMIPSIYGSFILYLFTTGFIFGGGIAFIMMHFPSRHMGKLIGLQFTLVGIINVLQYGLFEIAVAVDQTYYYINIAMLALCFVTLIHPVMILFELRKFMKTLRDDKTM